MKHYSFTFLTAVIIILALMMTKYDAWSMIAFINAASITSLVFICIGAILFVAGQGFFSGIAYSFRRFLKSSSKKWEMLEEPEEEYVLKRYRFQLTNPFLIIGVSFLAGCFLLSYTL